MATKSAMFMTRIEPKLKQEAEKRMDIVDAFRYMQEQMKEYDGKFTDEEVMGWVKEMRAEKRKTMH